MATLKDVAKLACVDVSTVSRALNNTSYVHPDTKARVYAAAKELGYHPNVMAQALRSLAQPGDILRFKGSHGMHIELVLEAFLKLDT